MCCMSYWCLSLLLTHRTWRFTVCSPCVTCSVDAICLSSDRSIVNGKCFYLPSALNPLSFSTGELLVRRIDQIEEGICRRMELLNRSIARWLHLKKTAGL